MSRQAFRGEHRDVIQVNLEILQYLQKKWLKLASLLRVEVRTFIYGRKTEQGYANIGDSQCWNTLVSLFRLRN
jgi:hypothetical protein